MEARQGQEIALLSCHEAYVKAGNALLPCQAPHHGDKMKKQKSMGYVSHGFLFYTRFTDGTFGGSVQSFCVLYSLIQSIKFDETVTVISEKTILLTGI